MRVLVVDDSGLMRRILTGVLHQECNISKIEEAANGKIALEMWKDNNYDLIMLDWNMPELVGIDVLRAIRATDRDTAVIFVTTEAEKEHIVEAIKEGANDYIIKPFTKTTVATKVGRVMKLMAKRQKKAPTPTPNPADESELSTLSEK